MTSKAVTSAAVTSTAVLAALHEIAPPALAAEWDNTGLLIEPKARRGAIRRLLLTIDLSAEVVAEAAAWGAEWVVAYHPAIFAGLKRLRHDDGKQRAVLAAVAAGLGVYSPHTALDAAPGGIADWLAAGVLGETPAKSIEPCGDGDFGRVVVFARPVARTVLVQRVKEHLGVRHLQIALPTRTAAKVRSVAVAAGAGSGILRGVRADVWLTGEMSHHDALAATAAGSTVLLAGHSNTERGYLRVLRDRLRAALGRSLQLRIAKTDRDPFTVT